MVKSNVPDCVGVPESVAVESEFDTNDNPGGNPPKPDTKLHVNVGENAPPDAVKLIVA